MPDLAERVDQAHKIISRLCSEGRGPRMSIPARDDAEDVFLSKTLDALLAEVRRLRLDPRLALAEEDLSGQTVKTPSGQDVPYEQHKADVERMRAALGRIADIAHAGGLKNMSDVDAWVAVRKETREFWDSRSIADEQRRTLATLSGAR